LLVRVFFTPLKEPLVRQKADEVDQEPVFEVINADLFESDNVFEGLLVRVGSYEFKTNFHKEE
jgi:hypothetical protein